MGWDLMILEFFSNVNDSMIPYLPTACNHCRAGDTHITKVQPGWSAEMEALQFQKAWGSAASAPSLPGADTKAGASSSAQIARSRGRHHIQADDLSAKTRETAYSHNSFSA